MTFTPDYSGLTIADMRELQAELDEILAETSSQNSIESVDRIYDLMLEFSGRTEFISGYRDEIREFDERRLRDVADWDHPTHQGN